MEWPTFEDMPQVFQLNTRRRGTSLPFLYVVDDTPAPVPGDDPFLAGLYAASSWAFTGIFGPILGPELFNDAINFDPAFEDLPPPYGA